MPGLDVARLYLSQRDRLRRLAYLMTGDADAADDVVQDAFARTQPRLDAVANPEYLRTTVTNLCLSWRRSRAMARQRVPQPDRTSVDPPEIDETWALLVRLPAEQRVALVLRYYEDLAHDDIAELMGCRPGTVRSRIHRALATLRKEMTP